MSNRSPNILSLDLSSIVRSFINFVIPDNAIKAFAFEMMIDIPTAVRWIVEYKKFMAL